MRCAILLIGFAASHNLIHNLYLLLSVFDRSWFHALFNIHIAPTGRVWKVSPATVEVACFCVTPIRQPWIDLYWSQATWLGGSHHVQLGLQCNSDMMNGSCSIRWGRIYWHRWFDCNQALERNHQIYCVFGELRNSF
jgi:hypothetical protein